MTTENRRLTREEFDAIVNRQVLDILKGEGVNEILTEAINNALLPVRSEQDSFRKELLAGISKSNKPQAEKGQGIGRCMRALAVAKGDPERAAAYALKVWGDDTVVKALSSSIGTDGGFLLRDEMADEMIELLRPASVVRSLNPITVPMEGGTLRIPKHTVGSTGGWIGENQPVPVTQPVYGQVVLSAKKYAALVPISNDLLRRASPMADTLVRDDLVADIATSTDMAFLRGTGAAAEPRGMRNRSANVIPQTAANPAAVTLNEATADLGRMLQTLGDNNVRMLRLGWIMEWRTWRWLITIRDGAGNLVFKPEMDRGTLFGFPFRVTSSLPRNFGVGANETELYLADFADVVIGETTGILLDISSEAAYQDGVNIVAAFSLDQTVVRAIVEVDLGLRHDQSVVVLTGVTWGV